MKKLLMKGGLVSAIALFGIVTLPASAQNGLVGGAQRAPVTNSAPVAKEIPVGNWIVDTAGGVEKMAARKGSQKAAGDIVSVFRPLAGCRLYDSRTGNPSALGTLGGSWAGNALRTLNAGGQCGIPSSNVAGLSLAINVFNWSAPATGRIAMMPVGQPITGNQVGFTAAQWFWTAANVKTTSGGNFDAQILDITAELIIDVNGYYQNVDTLDGNTEIDYEYALTSGDALEVTASAATGSARAITASSNSATGTALSLNNFAGGNAISVNSGRFRVAGAGVGSSDFVFQFSVNTAGTASAGTGTGCFNGNDAIHVITHPMLDNNPGAIVFITPKFSNGASGDGAHASTLYRALYLNPTSCGGGTGQNKWSIQNLGGTDIANNAKFNIMVIVP